MKSEFESIVIRSVDKYMQWIQVSSNDHGTWRLIFHTVGAPIEELLLPDLRERIVGSMSSKVRLFFIVCIIIPGHL